MNSKKKIESTALEAIPYNCKALYIQMYLASNNAGILSIDGYDPKQLDQLAKVEAIQVTSKFIFISNYLKVNYSKLRDSYNPQMKCLADIRATGYDYNFDLQTIEIPKEHIITDFATLIKAETMPDPSSGAEKQESRLDRFKIDHSKSATVQPRIIQIVRSPNFALILAMMLLICQSIHTSHTLLDLSGLEPITNYVFSIMSALLLDGLLIYFVAIGDTRNSFIFFLVSSLLNIYSYHIGLDSYWTYKSLFCFIPAIAIPYSIHAVSSCINQTQHYECSNV